MKVKRNDVYIASIYQQKGDMSVLEKERQLVINVGFSFVPFDDLKSGREFKELENIVKKKGAHKCLVTNVDPRLLTTNPSNYQNRFVGDLKKYYEPSMEENVGFIELAAEQKKLNRGNTCEISLER